LKCLVQEYVQKKANNHSHAADCFLINSASHPLAAHLVSLIQAFKVTCSKGFSTPSCKQTSYFYRSLHMW